MDRTGSGGHRVEERDQVAVEGEGASSSEVASAFNACISFVSPTRNAEPLIQNGVAYVLNLSYSMCSPN